MELKVIDGAGLQQHQFENLSKNLNALMKSRRLNAHQLSQLLGIPMMTIRRLLSGQTTDPRISTLKLIADHFNTSVDCLIAADMPIVPPSFTQNRPYFIPKLDWETTEKIHSIADLDLRAWSQWQSVALGQHETIGSKAFAIESRPSMYPRFPHGTTFVIDPEVTPTDGDIVLIKFKKNNELTLRELMIDPPEWQLHPIVAGSKIFHYSEQEHEIVGVNLLTMLYNRKTYS